ncbi:MAG: hypothetical protein AAGE01_21875 [Pseudomonadota bacterium]
MAARLTLIILVLALLAACAPRHAVTYPGHANRTAWHVKTGRVVSVELVTLEGDYGIVGTIGGAAIGREAGRTVGGGSGRDVAGAVGGVAGAVAGRAIEKAVTAEEGQELMIELDGGRVIAVVQDLEERFAVGERVRVLSSGRSTRVRPI